MMDFIFQNPTRIIFGDARIPDVAGQIPKSNKILMVYGSGSIKTNTIYEQTTTALKDHDVIEFSGIEPNPHYETLMEAVQLARNESVDYILAVGGGSVIDGCKFIAGATSFEGSDPWKICTGEEKIQSALPLGVILTLPATGSEMNMFSVVTHAERKEKRGFGSPHLFPKFSILDPSVCYSLPINQTANGIVDAFVHVMEQYLTYPEFSPIQDRFAEGLLLTLIEQGQVAMKKTHDYDARASVMWAATLALNGVVGIGVPHDWSTHMIGHELTAEFGMAHAETLAVILPTVMDIQRIQKQAKILQYGERVWNINTGSTKDRIDMAIDETRSFFEDLGVKTRLSEYGVSKEQLPPLVERLKEKGFVALGERNDITPEKSLMILEASL